MNNALPMAASEQNAPRSHEYDRTKTLPDIVGRIESTLESAVGPASPLVARLRALRGRLQNERFQLAVLGQFKRGKSTFINALLGAAVLPTGVVPLTAVAIFIAWRRAPLVIVHFNGNEPSEEFSPQTVDEIRNVLFRFVAEEANPKNRLGVERVELFYPADILADGTVIIDTPGVGSTLRHNTEAALQLLPECDAAFFVISADPPITEIELEYLRRLKSKTERVFFVLNKVDYLRSGERRSVVEFLQRVLVEDSLIEPNGWFFCISARDGLEAKQSGNHQALATSGVAELEDNLVRMLAREKNHWLQAAVRNKATDILDQASAGIDLRLRALNMPVEELAAKSQSFQDALLAIEQQRRVTRDLLTGDHRRIREALDTRIGELRGAIMTRLGHAVDTSLSGRVPKTWEETLRRTLSQAMQAEFEAACPPLVSAFAADAGAVLRVCQDRVNAIVDRVRQTAAAVFDVPLGSAIEHEPFALGEDPYWVTETVGASLIPDPTRLLDRLLPTSLRRSRLRARMLRQAEELVIRNAENLRWAIWRGLDDTFRKATAQFEERLDETIATTHDVIEDALARRHDRSFAVQPELDRLAAAKESLISLRRELSG